MQLNDGRPGRMARGREVVVPPLASGGAGAEEVRQAPAHAPCGPPFNCMFDIPRVLYVLYIYVLRRSVQYIMCEVTVL